MAPVKKIVRSGNKSVQAINTHLAVLSNELDELRDRPTEESLQQRAQEYDKSVIALTEFKRSLETLCDSFQQEVDGLFSDLLWESILARCSRYSSTYNCFEKMLPELENSE